MIIRQYSYFILNLFTLMLSSDMPELQSTEDIAYIKNKLAIDETEQKARKYFTEQFERVIKLSFTTKFDWMFHAINHNKKN
jgi:phosphatidylinositol-4,5-bisphosphate 3-kinase catalytic subunit alpha/beta/delta